MKFKSPRGVREGARRREETVGLLRPSLFRPVEFGGLFQDNSTVLVHLGHGKTEIKVKKSIVEI